MFANGVIIYYTFVLTTTVLAEGDVFLSRKNYYPYLNENFGHFIKTSFFFNKTKKKKTCFINLVIFSTVFKPYVFVVIVKQLVFSLDHSQY